MQDRSQLRSTEPAGTVFWITGLSGAGKTTVGEALADRLQALSRPVVRLDGDVLRTIFPGGDRFTPDARIDLARRYALLAREIGSQGVDVVCMTISMFDSVRAWNRDNIPNYIEAYLRVPLDELRQRDRKGVYTAAGSIVGVDIEPELPKTPDVIVDNDGSLTVAEAVDRILRVVPIRNPAGNPAGGRPATGR